VIQEEQIRFLYKVNKEAKVRRSTKSVVLGKARVMSYEDLVKARVERAVRDEAKAKGKETRGRKRKSAAPAPDSETNVPEPNLVVWTCEE
jgi:hypothetical protein